jgi:predicted aldo/keto reductase-like oxidoreductase
LKYRKFGSLDWQVSALGFGAMRLPQTSPNPADVDEAESIRMVRHAIEHGVNYIDTAYPYHAGRSEAVIGKALQDGYRQKVRLATKMPSWAITSQSDMDRYMDQQLRRLQTDFIDFYLLHGLNKDYWDKLRGHDVFKWAERAMAGGRIGKLGFSFHDEYSLFKEIIDAYGNWTFCQIQYNYMDTDFQAGRKGLRYAAARGLAVVVMEPLLGGGLAKEPPEAIARIWAEAGSGRNPAEWALLWVWEHPEVATVLSGMSTFSQLEQNLATADSSGPDTLTPADLKLVARARSAYKKMSPVPCTGCGYCQPCQQGVDIPSIFRFYNNGIMYDNLRQARFYYNFPVAIKPEHRADHCIECGECEEACPQKVPVIEWLKKVHAELDSKPK